MLLKKLNYSINQRQYPCILFIFSGYQDERKLVFEDGVGIDYQSIFNHLVDPLTAWVKIPKIIIVNTYQPFRPANMKSFFGIKSQTLPFCKSPFCLTMHITHAIGAAEKRGPSIQDTFISKFTSELTLINSRTPAKVRSSNDFSCILKHVYHSIVTESKISELNIKVQLDDQLIDSISIQEPPRTDNMSVSSTIPEDASLFIEDNHSHLPEDAFLINTDCLLEYDWYHGGLTRNESEEKLVNEGDFLVRQSLSPYSFGQLVLSVLYRDSLFQIPLFISHSGVNIKNEPIFSTLGELISYYLNDSNIISTHDTYVRITRGIYCRKQRILPKDSINVGNKRAANTWMHGLVTRQYVQCCLKDEGDFLVWETESHHIISFVLDGKIECIRADSTLEGTVTTDLIAGEFDDLNDLVQHLLLHHSYYRGVYLKTPVLISSNNDNRFLKHTISFENKTLSSYQKPNYSIDRSIPLNKQVWFCNYLTSEAASKILLNDGDFIVRTSQSKPGNLSIAVRAPKNVQTFGIFIHGNPTKYTLEPRSRTMFDNVVDLIDYYLRNALPLPISIYPQTFLVRPVNIQSVLNLRNH